MARSSATVMKQGKLAPWLYLLPAIIIMSIFIVYPMLNTINLSFLNKDSSASAATTCREGEACWGVFENYRYALTAELDLSNSKTAWQSLGATTKTIPIPMLKVPNISIRSTLPQSSNSRKISGIS